MCRLVMVAAAAAVAAPAAPAVSPDPATLAVPPEVVSKAKSLVKLLASEAYRDRDRATRELEQMGRLALPALLDGAAADDPEVRMRVVRLLPRAEADEMKARVDAFLADADAKYNHDLPGWQRFRALAGDDRSARDLFSDVVKNKANHDLLLALRGVPGDLLPGASAACGAVAAASPDRPAGTDLARALAARRQQMGNPFGGVVVVNGVVSRPNLPATPDIALLMLAETLLTEKQGGFDRFALTVTNFLQQPQGREAIAGNGKYGPALRQLALGWLDSRDGANGTMQAMSIAQTHNLGDRLVARYAARVLTVPGTHPYNRAHAVTVIAKSGGKEYLPAVVKQFDDEGMLIRGNLPGNNQPDVYVRDVALAMALLLTGQDPKAYGLDMTNANEAMKYNYSNFRFRTDATATAEAKRSAAFARWKNWEFAHAAGVAGTAAAATLQDKRYPVKEDKKDDAKPAPTPAR